MHSSIAFDQRATNNTRLYIVVGSQPLVGDDETLYSDLSEQKVIAPVRTTRSDCWHVSDEMGSFMRSVHTSN